MASDLKDLQRELIEQGWTLAETSDHRIKATPPDPTKRIVSFTKRLEGDRSWANCITELRRSGFQLKEDRRGFLTRGVEAPVEVRPPEIKLLPAPDPADEETAFRALKEARELCGFAREQLAGVRKQKEAILKAEAAAEAEAVKAASDLADAKAVFDAMFKMA